GRAVFQSSRSRRCQLPVEPRDRAPAFWSPPPRGLLHQTRLPPSRLRSGSPWPTRSRGVAQLRQTDASSYLMEGEGSRTVRWQEFLAHTAGSPPALPLAPSPPLRQSPWPRLIRWEGVGTPPPRR